MVHAQARLNQWLQGGAYRYYVLTGHPGHGVPSVRIRLYEALQMAEGLNLDILKVTATVTEDSPTDDEPAAIQKALDRWDKGEFDQRPVPLTPVVRGEGS